MGSYWVNTNSSRRGIISQKRNWGPKKLLTASKFAVAAGFSPYQSRDELLEEFRTGISVVPSLERREAMKRGKELEPLLRDYYCQNTGLHLELPGLMVPKFDPRIGAVVDGMVGDLILEIKTTSRIEPHLHQTSMPLSERIRPDHYAQIQGGMAISGVGRTDYFIFNVEDGNFVCIRVPYDSYYWDRILYPRIVEFLDMYEGLKSQ